MGFGGQRIVERNHRIPLCGKAQCNGPYGGFVAANKPAAVHPKQHRPAPRRRGIKVKRIAAIAGGVSDIGLHPHICTYLLRL
ncbi:hypothetical protein SDC9_116605 [bioreactor metagenome]|uniref:Uncharacterized protein n=1 Tax=bioreactor metagenome TaxID=1076179 RepID=A0A645BWU9_9ZZZZ